MGGTQLRRGPGSYCNCKPVVGKKRARSSLQRSVAHRPTQPEDRHGSFRSVKNFTAINTLISCSYCLCFLHAFVLQSHMVLSAIKIIKWDDKSEGDHFRRHLLCKPTQASPMSPPRVIQRIPLVTNLSKFILMLFASNLDIRYQDHPV